MTRSPRPPTDPSGTPTEQSSPRPDLIDRLEQRAAALPLRVGDQQLAPLLVRIVRRTIDVRVTGLAAEMTYYLLLSVIPLLTAIGASLGLLRFVVGEARVDEISDAMVSAIRNVLSDDVTEDLMAPLVEDLLRQQRGGLAITGLLLSIWLAGRVFRAAIRALDDAYEVEDRRSLPLQIGLSLAFAIGAVLTITVVLAAVVVGPLLGGARWLAEEVGASTALDVAWGLGRWPVVVAVLIAFLVWLYRAGPNVDNTWRDCLPGALVATALLLAVASGFRYYVQLAGPTGIEAGAGDEAVAAAGQFVGVVLAGVLFAWASSIAVLMGGVVNAELRGDAEGDLRPATRSDEVDEADEADEADGEPADSVG